MTIRVSDHSRKSESGDAQAFAVDDHDEDIAAQQNPCDLGSVFDGVRAASDPLRRGSTVRPACPDRTPADRGWQLPCPVATA
jgi:hypothetical protein